ncbi:MAG: hypothetical protein JSR46_08710, partial [Verrucomicrobia bacterium]|nr:hypothetical protein [Verrucomicrobiota bacterium]
PKGTARRWYPTGGIAKKVVYGADGAKLDVHEWDIEGRTYIRKKEPESEDIDKIAMHAAILTSTFRKLFQQVTAAMPMVESAVDTQAKDTIQDEFKKVAEQFLKLEKLHKELQRQSKPEAEQ